MSFDELMRSVLLAGPADLSGRPNWDASWRAVLVRNLEKLTRQLWQVGIACVSAHASFAEDKDHPNNIDGHFVCDLDRLKSGELVRELNLLDPGKIWTWDPASRRPYRGYRKKQLPMWHQRRAEHYLTVPENPMSDRSPARVEEWHRLLERLSVRSIVHSRS